MLITHGVDVEHVLRDVCKHLGVQYSPDRVGLSVERHKAGVAWAQDRGDIFSAIVIMFFHELLPLVHGPLKTCFLVCIASVSFPLLGIGRVCCVRYIVGALESGFRRPPPTVAVRCANREAPVRNIITVTVIVVANNVVVLLLLRVRWFLGYALGASANPSDSSVECAVVAFSGGLPW